VHHQHESRHIPVLDGRKDAISFSAARVSGMFSLTVAATLR
jgi:hypothetical protein